MLARIAESLFWIGRYMERADGTARILEATITGMHRDPWTEEDSAYRTLLAVMGQPPRADGGTTSPADVLDRLAYSTSPSSIVGAIEAARENAHGAREIVPSELWESLNGTWNSLESQHNVADIIGPSSFLAWVRDRISALSGILDTAMSRDDGYRFLVLGRALERVDMMCRLLLVRLRSTEESAFSEGGSWTVIVRAAGGHDAFLRAHRGSNDPGLVIEFLLIDRLFPRSIYHALVTAEQSLAALDPDASRIGVVDPARRIVGRARAGLEYIDPTRLLSGLDERLERLQAACLDAAEAVASRYFQYADAVAWVQEEA